MININGVIVTTEAEMEDMIVDMDEVSKASVRAQFAGVSNYVAPTQLEIDKEKYLKRSRAINNMIAEMASENVSRVRSGLWTVNDLVGLTQDAQIKEILSDLMSLSFEIAYGKVDGVTNALITSDIKTLWKAKLAANF